MLEAPTRNTDYEVSATYVDALLRALGPDALTEVLEALHPQAHPMLLNPWAEQWHPAYYLEAFGDAVVHVRGGQAFEDLAYTAMKDRFGDIVLPMFKRSLATSNRSPAAILSRLSSVIEVGIRGLDITWTSEGGQIGLLEVRYPRPVAAHLERSWRGVLRYVFEVTQSSGRVNQFFHSENGTTLQYRIEW